MTTVTLYANSSIAWTCLVVKAVVHAHGVALLNPWNSPLVCDDEGVTYVLDPGALDGTAAQVAKQVVALRQAGVEHLLRQMSFG